MLREGPPFVARRRRTGIAQPDAPVVDRRHQDEREQAARQRLGLVGVLLVDSAAPLWPEGDAGTAVLVAQVCLRLPRCGAPLEARLPPQLLARPSLRFDPRALVRV